MIGDNSRAAYLEFDQRIEELNRRGAELAAERKKLRDDMRAVHDDMRRAGIDPEVYELVRRLGGREDAEVMRYFNQLGQGLVWRERPIGYQPALFDDTSTAEPVKRGRGRPRGSTDSYKRPPRRKVPNGAEGGGEQTKMFDD